MVTFPQRYPFPKPNRTSSISLSSQGRCCSPCHQRSSAELAVVHQRFFLFSCQGSSSVLRSRRSPTGAEQRQVITFLMYWLCFQITAQDATGPCHWPTPTAGSRSACCLSGPLGPFKQNCLWPFLLRTPKISWYQLCQGGQGSLSFPMPHMQKLPKLQTSTNNVRINSMKT